jgi:hypothetical protein
MNIFDEVLNDVVGEEDEETTPLWSENFKIIDISSRYFGACFIGLINDEIVSSGCRSKVINAMLDYERI